MKTKILILLLSTFHFTLFSQDIKINKRSIKYLQKNIEPIQLGQKDYSFLDELISNKRVIVLGEEVHGTKEMERVRADIIQHLYEKHGFDVLLVESDMDAVRYANTNKQDLTAKEILQAFHRVWYSEGMKAMIGSLRTNSEIDLVGFDSQFGFPAHYSLISNHDTTYTLINQLANQISYERNMSKNRHKAISDSLITLYKAVLSHLPKDENYDWSVRIIQNKINVLKRQMPIEVYEQPFAYYRDSLMADNMEWLIEEKFPDRKIIIWAANAHVAACTEYTSLPKMYFSGKKLFENEKVRKSTYILLMGFYEGTTSFMNRKYLTPPSSYDGVEILFNQMQTPSFFLDVSTPKIKRNNQWMTQKIKMFPTYGYSMSGIYRAPKLRYVELVPRDCFDGIIYFKQVNASSLMKKE